MKNVKEIHFPESPMKLQLLAACAAPLDHSLGTHPHHGEDLLRLQNSAIRIQRKWRYFLQSRGRYRTMLCRYYMGSRCKNGVECTFAHGRHDLRHNFPRRNMLPSRGSGSHNLFEGLGSNHGDALNFLDFMSHPCFSMYANHTWYEVQKQLHRLAASE